MKPQPWKSAALTDLRAVRGVCLDIDETLSTQGKLTAEAFSALWKLKQSGFAVVPITGRPSGWCDHIARFWPVDAVIGENGAFTFFMDQSVRKRIDTPTAQRTSELKRRLESLGDQIKKEFPQARWASDQAYREFDLAIDICEDVPAWSSHDVERLLDLCKKQGAHAKLSSIHVNVWFGDYDKKKGMEYWINQGSPGLKPMKLGWDQWLFIGDSPNDEPMFASFKYTVGVANLKKYIERLKSPPRWITEAESGSGFAEMVEYLIQSSQRG